MLYGTPFLFKIRTTGSQTTTFLLDTSNADLDGDGVDETTPFSGMVLFITGLRIINGANNKLTSLVIDDRIVMSGTAATSGGLVEHADGEDLFFDGYLKSPAAAATTAKAPRLRDVYNVPALVCRYNIKYTTTASSGSNTSDMYVRGWNMPRKI